MLDSINIRSKSHHGENRSMMRVMRDVIKYEGFMGFFKGIHCQFFGSTVYGFLYFTIYQKMKQILNEYTDGPMKFMLASMVTQGISLIALYPFDVIKVRMQSSNHIYKYKNIYQAFRSVV